MRSLPLWIRKALVDAIEGAVVAIGALNLVLPQDPKEARDVALVMYVALAGAAVAAFRRAFVERGIDWIRGKVVGDE